MSNLQEVFEQMTAGEVSGVSEFGVRDETLRSRVQIRRLGKVDLQKGLRRMVYPHLELAVPLDPTTGTQTETYNDRIKYNPLMPVSTLMSFWKNWANKKEETKKFLMKGSGVKEWDTSDVENINEVDMKVFKRFRGPRIFTLNVISVNDRRITGKENSSRQYRVDVKRDAFGKVIGERKDQPILAQIASVYNNLTFGELTDVRAKREADRTGQPHTLKKVREYTKGNLSIMPQKDFDENVLALIRRDVPITNDRPVNFIVANVFEPDRKQKLDSEELKEMSEESFDSSVCLFRINERLQEGLNMYATKGTLEDQDTNIDYYELSLEAPNEIENPTGNEKMDLGRKTPYNKPTVYISAQPEVKQILDARIAEYVTNNQDIESRFIVSSFVNPVDDTIEKQMMDLMVMDDILHHPYMNGQILDMNIHIIREAYGPSRSKEIDAMLTAYKMGIKTPLLSNQEIDIATAEEDARKFDLMEAATEAAEASAVSEEEADDIKAETEESHQSEGADGSAAAEVAASTETGATSPDDMPKTSATVLELD